MVVTKNIFFIKNRLYSDFDSDLKLNMPHDRRDSAESR
jgi:hypothetical protein